MSISRTVYLRRSALPTPTDWALSIRTAGFEMDLPTDFDLEEMSGFLPCTYCGHEAGFEYAFDDASSLELDDELRGSLGERDVAISFVTHADMRGLVTAVIAAAVLAATCDGIVHDEESGEVLLASEALASARELETEVAADLD
jgi:hypothetical protein